MGEAQGLMRGMGGDGLVERYEMTVRPGHARRLARATVWYVFARARETRVGSIALLVVLVLSVVMIVLGGPVPLDVTVFVAIVLVVIGLAGPLVVFIAAVRHEVKILEGSRRMSSTFGLEGFTVQTSRFSVSCDYDGCARLTTIGAFVFVTEKGSPGAFGVPIELFPAERQRAIEKLIAVGR